MVPASPPLGSNPPLDAPRRFGATTTHNLPPIGSSRFVGRTAELRQLHEALSQGHDGPAADCPVVIHGPSGLGKSALAFEYASRFAAAWPGGIYWLRALGGGPPPADPDALACRRAEECATQLAAFADDLGLSATGMDENDLRNALATRLDESDRPYLWIVDDLPACSTADLAGWLAPGRRMGRTLITTRSAGHGMPATALYLDGLSEPDAAALLTGGQPCPPRETDIIDRIVRRLNGHALALNVAEASCRHRGPAAMLGCLEKSHRDILELGTELAGELPVGLAPPIAAAILAGFADLPAATGDILRLASALGTAPIGTELLGDCLAAADGLDATEALQRADLGIRDAIARSLAEAAPDRSAIGVHPLIARAWRLRDRDAGRLRQLETAATEALGKAIAADLGRRNNQRLDQAISHARHLAGSANGLHGMHLAGLIGRYDHGAGRYAFASRWIRASHDELPERLGHEHPDTLAAKSALSLALAAEGKLAEARSLEEEVLAALQRHLGHDDPDTLAAMTSLAQTLERLGDIPGACELYRRLLAGGSGLAPRHPDITTWAFKLFLHLLATDAMTEAASIYNQYLFWLRTAGQLDPMQQAIRDQLLTHFHPPSPRAKP